MAWRLSFLIFLNYPHDPWFIHSFIQKINEIKSLPSRSLWVIQDMNPATYNTLKQVVSSERSQWRINRSSAEREKKWHLELEGSQKASSKTLYLNWALWYLKIHRKRRQCRRWPRGGRIQGIAHCLAEACGLGRAAEADLVVKECCHLTHLRPISIVHSPGYMIGSRLTCGPRWSNQNQPRDFYCHVIL